MKEPHSEIGDLALAEFALERVQEQASGYEAGIWPQRISKEAIESSKERRDMSQDFATSYPSVPDMAKAAFYAATYRDLRYSVCGRKFLRIAGLTGKARAAFCRDALYKWIDAKTS